MNASTKILSWLIASSHSTSTAYTLAEIKVSMTPSSKSTTPQLWPFESYHTENDWCHFLWFRNKLIGAIFYGFEISSVPYLIPGSPFLISRTYCSDGCSYVSVTVEAAVTGIWLYTASRPFMPNMRIYTNTALVCEDQYFVMELLLLHHPVDCSVCDQGGECELQEQSFHYGSDRGSFFFFLNLWVTPFGVV